MKGKKIISMLSLTMAVIFAAQTCVTDVHAASLADLVSAEGAEFGEAIADGVSEAECDDAMEETDPETAEEESISTNDVEDVLQPEA